MISSATVSMASSLSSVSSALACPAEMLPSLSSSRTLSGSFNNLSALAIAGRDLPMLCAISSCVKWCSLSSTA